MHVDALTLAAVTDELRGRLIGARIEDVIQPTPDAVALQCYGGGRNVWLLASAHPQLARAHLVEGKPRKLAAEPPAFVMLLRKHLEGARLVALQQPRWERIIEMGFARGPLDAASDPTIWCIIEIMGRLSNLILRDEAGIILGALHTVSADVNTYRALAPHVPYRYPPPQTRMLHGQPAPRLDGEEVTASALREATAELLEARAASQDAPTSPPPPAKGRKAKSARREAPSVAGLLAAQVAGFSRELGREVAARAVGQPDVALTLDLPWGEIASATQALARLPETRDWHPTLVLAHESEPPTAFAVYEPRQYAGATLRPLPSVNALLDTYYQGAEWRAALEGAKANLRHTLRTHRDRCQRKDGALREELAALDEAQRLREEADILLAFQTDVPERAPSFTTENPFAEVTADSDTPSVTITLDPRYSVVENANRRYARYHKLQRAASVIPAQIEANALELARIEQLLTDLALAETPAEITPVRLEIAEAGYLRGNVTRDEQVKLAKALKGSKSKPGKSAKGGKYGKGSKPTQPARKAPEGGAPLKRQSSDGFALLVGKNSRQNEEVTFHLAANNDLWLHARGVPGAHAIIKSGGRPVPETTIREAAALAAYYSQSRENGSVLVDYTEQRYVRHMKGGGPGMVIYERERTIHVAPADLGA